MKGFPIFLDLRGRPCLVVGGASPAAAKVRLLLQAGAKVTVVTLAPGREIAALAEAGEVALAERAFADKDVAGRVLVIGATGNRGLDRQVTAAARSAGVPVNIVDRPELSDFAMPAIVDRGPLTIAISSGGTAPMLARQLRAGIEAMVPAGTGRLVEFADGLRDTVRARIADAEDRRRFWQAFFEGPAADAVLKGDTQGAGAIARDQIDATVRGDRASGRVSYVDTGPGDPDLLPLKALRLLQKADLVVHDALIRSGILDLARREAERVAVNATPEVAGDHMERIADAMATRAQEGCQIVRLAGPAFFASRAGEDECRRVQAAGVHTEFVPGVAVTAGPGSTHDAG